jgi:hypothetical protein
VPHYRSASHDARYVSSRRAAIAEVPWYRENWLGRDRQTDVPTVGAEVLEEQTFRFFPLSRPFRSGEHQQPPFDGRGLVSALAWTGVTLWRQTVFECRRAWLDPVTLSAWRQLSYAVLLDPPVGADPGGRQAALRQSGIDRLAQARGALVVGTDAQRRHVQHLVDGPASVRRIDLGTDAHLLPDGGPVVVYDGLLGYLGGIHPACGRVHLSWRRYWARNSEAGVALTGLSSCRPRLVDVVPRWGAGWRARLCPTHGSPVLERLDA